MTVLLEFRPTHTPDTTVDSTLSAALVLPRRPEACPDGRHWLLEVLAKWGVGDEDLLYRAEHCLSETLGNAISHPRVDAPETVIRVQAIGGRLEVTVSDPDPYIHPSDATSSAEHGRGLMLVAAMSDGYWATETASGKDVVFAINLGGAL